MANFDYLESDLRSCKLCEWRCGADRLAGETGICGISIPLVAVSQLHPAPPASFDAFLVGCNFKCLFCQNWSISMYHERFNSNTRHYEGYYKPETWAELGTISLTTPVSNYMGADRLFFTGGEPTCSLPWIEKVVETAREYYRDTKVNFDTNGYMTKDSLKRILEFTTSITYDLKAIDPKLFAGLTGAFVQPVLRNLKYILKTAPEKLWEVRVMVIPGVHEHDIIKMGKFLADFDPGIKLNFLAFRPNFIMENYPGASEQMLNKCVDIAISQGLTNVTWNGRAGINKKIPDEIENMIKSSESPRYLAIPFSYARYNGCKEENRNCKNCLDYNQCPIKIYRPVSDY